MYLNIASSMMFTERYLNEMNRSCRTRSKYKYGEVKY